MVNDERKVKHQKPIKQEDISQKKINILDSVDIELRDPAGRIQIVPFENQVQWRKFNKKPNEDWSWYITPKKDEGGKANATLVLYVSTKGVGESTSVITKEYNLKIELPETIWQAFLRKMRDIGWVVNTVGGVIGYYLGIWKEKKKNSDAKKGSVTAVV